MKKTFAALALAAGASVANAQVGEKLPDLDVLQWFNSPPIAAEPPSSSPAGRCWSRSSAPGEALAGPWSRA
jgi:hypothetical protein